MGMTQTKTMPMLPEVAVTMTVPELLALYRALGFVMSDQMAEGLFPTRATEREANSALKKLQGALRAQGVKV